MSNQASQTSEGFGLTKPFWVLWALEFWERFGFYGVQGIIVVYFVHTLGYSEKEAFHLYGSYAAFVYGFAWIGGWVGDWYLGGKRTMMLGAFVLMLSYGLLTQVDKETIYYALSGIIVGNTLFKANPSSLISKIYQDDYKTLDGAMTMYYMAINVGSFLSLTLVPMIAVKVGYSSAFWVSCLGMMLGIVNYCCFSRLLKNINTPAGAQPLQWNRLFVVIAATCLALWAIATLLPHEKICQVVIVLVSIAGLSYFLLIAFSLPRQARNRMLIAAVLLLQGVLFFVLYNQMPTSLTFFAKHNIDNNIFGYQVPPEQYQALNGLMVVLFSPLLAYFYRKVDSTHVTKFCIGMTLCSVAFLILAIPQFYSETGIISPIWIVFTYAFQSAGELLISGLGLAMVAQLCPPNKSGFVMGIWLLTSMIAGPISAVIASATVPESTQNLSVLEGMYLYSNVFEMIGLVTAGLALAMWIARPWLNRVLANASA